MDVADLDIPVPVGAHGRSGKGHGQGSSTGSPNVDIHVLAGGKTTDDGWVVVGKASRGGRSKAVAASNGPAVKVTLPVAIES